MVRAPLRGSKSLATAIQVCFVILMLGLAAALGGCTLLGLGAAALADDKDRVPVEYEGLKGQTVAIMVYVDWGTRVDFPGAQLALAASLQDRLLEGQTRKKVGGLKGAEFVDPRSVVLFQKDHPELAGRSITDIAPMLGTARVVYVELEQLETRSPLSPQLLRGTAKATLRVVEVAEDGKAKVVVEQPGIEVHFPPKSPEGVAPSERYNDVTVYRNTIASMAVQLGKYFKVYDE